MININFKQSCTGCQACADVCPQKCITIQEDRDGFLIPTGWWGGGDNACIECKRCEQVCPVLHHEEVQFDNHKVFSAHHINKDIRHYGSSGSVFYALAEYTISHGGAVYGAAFDKCLQLRHMRVVSIDELQPLMKSKYIQSNTYGIYKCVIDDLRDGLQVLFVGTPCQCRALHNMTSARLRENLIIVDVVCHGVSSQALFNKSIKNFEIKHACKVIDFSFREKTPDELRNYKIIYRKLDGTDESYMGDHNSFPYCFGFFNHLIWRNSCYNCRLRRVERVSDLTLGDFWGIDKIRPEVKDFVKGYTVVITNTEKGNRIMENLKGLYVQEIPEGIEYTKKYNHAYVYPDKKSIEHTLFFYSFRHFGYAFCEKYFLQLHSSLVNRLLHSLIIHIDKIFKL